jgi:hypothetical protein
VLRQPTNHRYSSTGGKDLGEFDFCPQVAIKEVGITVTVCEYYLGSDVLLTFTC